MLYADLPCRPNIPANVLVGLEALKAGFGWSDEGIHDAFVFDVQVRYALGYRNLARANSTCSRSTTCATVSANTCVRPVRT